MMSSTTCTKHNCDYHDELLTVYATGNASQEERQRVEKWLSQCPDCQRKVMELEQTWWALDVWEEDQRQVPLRINNFHARLAEVKNEQPAWRRVYEHVAFFFRPPQLVPAMSMAAVALFAVVFLYHLGNNLMDSQQDNPAISVTNPVDSTIETTPINSQAVVLVGDSTTQQKNARREAFFDEQVRRARLEEMKRAQSFSNRMSYTKTAGFVPNRNIVSAHNSLDEEVQLRPGYIQPNK